jgi:hypothetical protein
LGVPDNGLTTGEVTTGEVTTGEVTTGELTTGEVTTDCVSTYVFGVPDNASVDNEGDLPAFAKLSTSLFRCFLIAFISSANAAALYCSLISLLAKARACASGDIFLRVSGT